MAPELKINPIHAIIEKWRVFKRSDEDRRQKKPPQQGAKDNMALLTEIAHEIHTHLEAANAPFRLCVYEKGDDVYIDVVTLDKKGGIKQTFRHDITYDELEDILLQLNTGRGLVYNTTA